jgi:U1 small nuclear ribonucleoprotein C
MGPGPGGPPPFPPGGGFGGPLPPGGPPGGFGVPSSSGPGGMHPDRIKMMGGGQQ